MELLQFVIRGRCESIEPYYDAKPGQPIKAMFTISSRVYHWHSTIARGTLTDECGSSLTRNSSTVIPHSNRWDALDNEELYHYMLHNE